MGNEFPCDREEAEKQMRSLGLFLIAGLLEVGGGYLVWLWLREQRPVWYAIAGFAFLSLYGVVPVLQPVEHPFGRIYAAYGAVFIILSTFWGWGLDHRIPDVRDWIGVVVCLVGALVIMWPRPGILQP